MRRSIEQEDVSEVLRSTLEAYHIQRFRESCISKLLDSSVDPNIKEEILKHVSEMKESVALILLMVRDSIEIGKDEFKVMNKEAATYAVQQGTDFDGSSGSSSHRDDHDNVEDRSVESARSSSSKQLVNRIDEPFLRRHTNHIITSYHGELYPYLPLTTE